MDDEYSSLSLLSVVLNTGTTMAFIIRPMSVSPSSSPSSWWETKSPALLILVLALSCCLPLMVGGVVHRNNNSSTTITTSTTSSADDSIYEILHVQPPGSCPFPRWKMWSWKCHSRLLPLLHFGQDRSSCPPDVFVNLRILWNKALTSVDPKSPAYEKHEGYPTYHLLPRISRWILFRAIPVRMYPRWLHANIELRTVYLNQAIQAEIEHILGGEDGGETKNNNNTNNDQEESSSSPSPRIELVILGGGYDTRSIRTLLRFYPHVNRVWELDFKAVVESKQKLLQSLYRELPQYLLKPSPSTSTTDGDGGDHHDNSAYLRFQAIDLNDLDLLESVLSQIAQEQEQHSRGTKTHTIIVTEAVLMYLDKGVPTKILQLCMDKFGSNASWIFVDRIRDMQEESSGNDLEASRNVASNYLASIGWQLVDWWIKPGATRHMGVARSSSRST